MADFFASITCFIKYDGCPCLLCVRIEGREQKLTQCPECCCGRNLDRKLQETCTLPECYCSEQNMNKFSSKFFCFVRSMESEPQELITLFRQSLI